MMGSGRAAVLSPALALGLMLALGVAALVGCEGTPAPTKAGPDPAVASAEAVEAAPEPEPEPEPEPVRPPELGELLDAAMGGPVEHDEAIRWQLRQLELSAGDVPVTVRDAGWPEAAEAALTLVDGLGAHGLDPQADDGGPLARVAALAESLEGLRADALAFGPWTGQAAVDQEQAVRLVHAEHLTAALYLELAELLGATRPAPPERKARVRERLLSALGTWEDPAALMATLPPPMAVYDALRAALPRYRELAAGEGFVAVPKAVRKARPGKTHADLPALRARLAQEDPLGAGEGEGDDTMWDEALTEALRRARDAYQLSQPRADRRLVDRALLEALKVPAATRLSQLRHNLERLRQSALRDHPYVVYVNLPDFHGEVWDGPESPLRFKTVVGSPRARRAGRLLNATPPLVARIDTIIYNPYWNVPERIFKEELLRDEEKWQEKQAVAAATDAPLPDFWEAKRFEVMNADNPDRLWVRRKPGPGNALGKVKFMFENRYFVFLHDTSDKRKFSAARRAFSHGCMRVQKPLELAELLLRRDGTWHEATEGRVFKHYRETPIVLNAPVPIVVDYVTARADEEGRVHFLTDIYGRDAARVAER